MKKVLFLFVFIIAGNACFAQLTGKNYRDSVLNYFNSDSLKKINPSINKVLLDPRSTDSLKLFAYETQQKYYTHNGFATWLVAKTIVDQGITLEHIGADSSIVLSKFREAYSYTKANNNPKYTLWVAIRIAKHYLNIGALNTPEELKYYNEVLTRITQESKNRDIWYLGYNYLANRSLRFYDFKTALEYFNKSYKMAKNAADIAIMAEVGANILEVYNKNNDTIGVKNLATSFEREIPEDKYALRGWFYLRLTGFDNLFNQETRAYYLQLADEYYKISNDKTDRNLLLFSFCKYYEEIGNLPLLRKYLDAFREELKNTPPTQLFYYTSQIEMLEGQYFSRIGNYPRALDFYNQSLAEAKEIDAPVLLPTIYKEMYKTSAKYSAFENAYTYLMLYNEHQDAVFTLHKSKEIQDLIVHYEADKKQLTINNLEIEKKLSEQIVEEKTNANVVLRVFLVILGVLSLLMIYLYILNRIKSKKLSNLNKLKDTVFSVLSHDLRSPLNTFKSLIVISNRKNLSTEQYKKYLDVIQTEVSNTSMFLDNLLQWAQANQNMLPVKTNRINVLEMLVQVKKDIELDLKAKDAHFEINCEPEMTIHSDIDLLSFILRNIVYNAVKFSPKNAKVSLNVLQNSSTVITIEDHGKGMSRKEVNEFYTGKMDASLDATGEKSTGLGLVLCKEFATKLDINLSVESELTKGSVFSLEIPKNKKSG